MKERLGEVKRSEVKPQQRRSLREERAQKGETQNEFGKKRGNFSHGNTQRRYETRRDQSERSKRSSSSSCMMIITMIAHARRVFSSLLHPLSLSLSISHTPLFPSSATATATAAIATWFTHWRSGTILAELFKKFHQSFRRSIDRTV